MSVKPAAAQKAVFGSTAKLILVECGPGFTAVKYNETYLKLVEICNDRFQHFSLGATTIRRFEQSGCLASQIAKADKSKLPLMLGEDKFEALFTARNISTYIARMSEEVQRVFRFRKVI